VRILGIVPARGGSKGVPRKNLRLLGGKPLLAYTVEAALEARGLTRVILTTDDQEIASTGERLGIEVPFLRPPELAADTTPMLPVVQHAVRFLEQGGDFYDAVCLLQPTNPFRTSAQIDAALELFERSGADSLVTVLPVPAEYNPHWVYFEQSDGSLRLSTGEAQPVTRRQDLPAAYHREGSVYVTRREVLMERNSLYGSRLIGFRVDSGRTVNIDSFEDWTRAEELVAAGRE
jgi:CMP-N,N'-diacetyllegionaminic acid synthase